MGKLVLCAVALVALVWTQGALAEPTLVKGKSIFAVQLTDGTGDFVTAAAFDATDGYIRAFQHSEIGVQAQFWHLVSNDWAVNVAGGIGFFKETNEPGNQADASDIDFEYSQSSWQARLGVDRVVHLTEAVHLLFGPGVQVWSGKGKWEGQGFPVTFESQNATRIALSGRLGAHVALSSHFGIVGQIGHYLGRATAEEDGAKASWWPSGYQAGAGFGFHF